MRFTPLLALLALATPAFASNPTSSYVYPSRVDFIPDQANATQIVIHGAFFFYTQNFMYTSPACGKMFFACKQGEEAMCRMQWGEIAAAIGGNQCEGFGQWSMAPTAKLYAEGDALGAADLWDLGMGISPGVFVDGKCDPAKQLNCGGSAPDSGAPADLAGTIGPDLAPGPAADLAGTIGPDLASPADMSKIATPNGGCGCTVGSRAPALPGALALLALVALLRRRSR